MKWILETENHAFVFCITIISFEEVSKSHSTVFGIIAFVLASQ